MATGSQWDLVQTFGWARMMVSYSRTMPLLEAAKRTFSGEMCGVCELVNDAGRKEQSQSPTLGGKLETKQLFLAQSSVACFAPALSQQEWTVGDFTVRGAGRSAPPTPPPRA